MDIKINDGSYAVREVVNHDAEGRDILGEAVGHFEIIDGKVTRKTGVADEVLRLGSVDGPNHYRITHTMHNGYITVVPEYYPGDEI